MVRRIVAAIAYSLLLAVAVAQTATQRKDSDAGNGITKACTGLHAGIRAQIIPPYTETSSVMLSFVLLNDSETPREVEAGSWRIVVNGHELNDLDTQQIFGNGPMPVGGYRVLKPGETYEFGKALSISQYFLPNGEHRVSWKGAAFQSPTITVTITPASH
jgi:hypothetical protein